MYVPMSAKQLLVAALTLVLSSAAIAAGKHSGGHGHGGGNGHGRGASIGEPGKASEATRTIEIVMTDNRYAPERISIKKGETIRFVKSTAVSLKTLPLLYRSLRALLSSICFFSNLSSKSQTL